MCSSARALVQASVNEKKTALPVLHRVPLQNGIIIMAMIVMVMTIL
jgi:hypothetical protein